MGPNEEVALPKKRPQFFYFYGSTEETRPPGPVPSNETDASAGTSPDTDSLVGESLLPTDTEDENTPKTSASDFEHLIITNGRSSQAPPTYQRGSTSEADGSYSNKSMGLISRVASIGTRRLVLVTVLVVGVAALTLAVVEKGHADDPDPPTVAAAPPYFNYSEPFPQVSRGHYGDPVDQIIDVSLFHPSLRDKIDAQESKVRQTSDDDGGGENEYGPAPKRDFVFPFPTGAFWVNLVLLKTTADRGLSFPVTVYPYGYKWNDELLQVSYPAQHRSETDLVISDYFFPDLTFLVSEQVVERYVTHFDPLSATLKYIAETGSWQTYLVQGSPYITIKYENVSPILQAFTMYKDVMCPGDAYNYNYDVLFGQRQRRQLYGVCFSSTDGNIVTLKGVQFWLQTQENMNWFIFSSDPITLTFDKSVRRTVSTITKFTGVLRIAFIPTAATMTQDSIALLPTLRDSTGIQRLIYHASVYPVSADVAWSFSESGGEGPYAVRTGTVNFKFQTVSIHGSDKALLMLSLPHHQQLLSSDVQLARNKFDLDYRVIKGVMRPVVGDTWSYDEPLPSLELDGGYGSNLDNGSEAYFKNPTVRRTIINNLRQDLHLSPPTLSENVYGFGKQIARLAQLAHIASRLKQPKIDKEGEKNEDPDDIALDGVYNDAIDALSNILKSFLVCEAADHLVYDGNLGGIVSIDGLKDSGADFGNGRYNDHHFHYGYTLYAAAILGMIDPSFIDDYGHLVDAIYYDIAYDGNMKSGPDDGVFFPFVRHKMWFDGHSFASGLFPFADGKSQESSSEAVNSYYGAMLWSQVRQNHNKDKSLPSPQANFARLLLAMEIRGAQTYWQMVPPSTTSSTDGNQTDKATGSVTVYDAAFSKNYMVGNLGMIDAICSTWFGNENLYVQLINFLPVTSVTGDLFRKEYAEDAYPNVLEAMGVQNIEMAWRGYFIAYHAILDPTSAWKEAQDLYSPQLDAGISKSQVLYWITTRKGFKLEVQSGDDGDDSNQAQLCSNNPACLLLGLKGQCCPTAGGVFLDCCIS